MSCANQENNPVPTDQFVQHVLAASTALQAYANLVRNWATITIANPQQLDARAAVLVKSHHRTTHGASFALMGSFLRMVSVSTVPLAGKVLQTEVLVWVVRPLGRVHTA